MAGAVILVVAVIFLGYTNGANDNFKGVATLFGSKTAHYRTAIAWATATTLGGSLASLSLAGMLVKQFSGKGLVPDAVAVSPEFLSAVAIGAALTVLTATLAGFPVSTTHSLIGALVGSGFLAAGSQIDLTHLWRIFLLPLVVSPVAAGCLAGVLYAVLHGVRRKAGICSELCFCVGGRERVVMLPEGASALSFEFDTLPELVVDSEENCIRRYTGNVCGISIQKALDSAHFLSAGIVSFARGLNDTPKIVALILVVTAFDIHYGIAAVAAGMAVGGLLNARKVARRMSTEITPLTHGQGFAANIVTGFLVIVASRLGMPVSTTHVSVGSIFGIGLFTRQADIRTVRNVALSWVLTLPAAILLSAGAYIVLEALP